MARFSSLKDFCEATGYKKNRIAQRLGVTPQFFSYLLEQEIYRPKVSDELAGKIAALLNQSEQFVRKLYPKAA